MRKNSWYILEFLRAAEIVGSQQTQSPHDGWSADERLSMYLMASWIRQQADAASGGSSNASSMSSTTASASANVVDEALDVMDATECFFLQEGCMDAFEHTFSKFNQIP